MPNSFLVMSWNVERKGKNAFTKNSDLANDIINPIVDSLEKTFGEITEITERPFVAYLLEFKGTPDELKSVQSGLKAAYKTRTGRELNVAIDDLGGGSYTQESIITLSDDLEVTNSRLDIAEKLKPKIEADAEAGEKRAAAQETRLGGQQPRKARKFHKNHKYGQEHIPMESGARFRANPRGIDEFRDGMFSEIKFEGQTLKVAVAHAPGPKITEAFPEVVQATLEQAKARNADLIIGDFNTRGTLSTKAFEDPLHERGQGTTYGKLERQEGRQTLGTAVWDRALVKPEIPGFSVKVSDPVVSGKVSLTDHTRIETLVTQTTPEPEPPTTDLFATQETTVAPDPMDTTSSSTSVAPNPLTSEVSTDNPFTAAGESESAAAGQTPFDVAPAASEGAATLTGTETAASGDAALLLLA
jgi:hypothetical protein